MVDVLSIGSGDCLACHGRPLDGVSIVGATPDHLILTACCLTASHTVGVVDVGRPQAPPLIEGSEGGRLNSEVSGLHGWLFADVLSIGGGVISGDH